MSWERETFCFFARALSFFLSEGERWNSMVVFPDFVSAGMVVGFKGGGNVHLFLPLPFVNNWVFLHPG